MFAVAVTSWFELKPEPPAWAGCWQLLGAESPGALSRSPTNGNQGLIRSQALLFRTERQHGLTVQASPSVSCCC
jgi:hypothetical protein